MNETTKKLSIYKPHGSINWTLTHNGTISVSNQPTSPPVIVAPSHLKFVGSLTNGESPANATGYLNNASQLSDIWSEMEKELKSAKAIVFIGYSIPSADLYFASLLRTVFSSRKSTPKIALVNPDAAAIGKRLKSKFGIVTKQYFSLEEFNGVSRKSIVD